MDAAPRVTSGLYGESDAWRVVANKRGLRCGILPHGWMPTPLKGFMTKKGVGVGGKGAEMGCECPTRPKCSLQGLPFLPPAAPASIVQMY